MGRTFEKQQGCSATCVFTANHCKDVGGVMKAPDGASFQSIWAIYFGMLGSAATAEQLKSLGYGQFRPLRTPTGA